MHRPFPYFGGSPLYNKPSILPLPLPFFLSFPQ